MKKYLKVLFLCLIFFTLFSLCSCSLQHQINPSESQIVDSQFVDSDSEAEDYDLSSVLSQDEHYIIYTDSTGRTWYKVFDDFGNVVISDMTYYRIPEIEMVSETIIKVTIQSGTGVGSRGTYYYDFENSMKSKYFMGVIGENEELAVYVGYSGGSHSDYAVVENIFENSDIEKQIKIDEFSYELSYKYYDPILEAEISDNSDEVTLSYYAYVDGTEKMVDETFHLG